MYFYIYRFAAAAIVFFWLTPVSAETIVLKSGQVVKAKILQKTDHGIKVEMYGTAIKFSNEEIDKIEEERGSLSAPGVPAEITGEVRGREKEEIIGKMMDSAFKFNRVSAKMSSAMEMDIGGKVGIKMDMEDSSEIDTGNKIMYSLRSMKSLQMDPEFMAKQLLEGKIAELKQQGVTEEEIKKKKEELRLASQQTAEALKMMNDKMKDIKKG